MLSGYAIKVRGRVPVLSRVRRRNSRHRAFARLQPLLPSSSALNAAPERLNSVHARRHKEIIADGY